MFFKNFYSKYPMFFRCPDAGDGGGGAGGAAGADDKGSGGADDKGAGGTGDDNKGGQDKTFTQADIDRIVKDRLDRERKKYEGVDVEDYKKMKADAQAKADAEKTELEKAQEKIQKAESDKKEALRVANERLLRAEFKVLAQEKGIKYVDDAFKLADLSTTKVNDDGTVEGLGEVLDTLIKDKPFLVEVSGGTGKVDHKSKDDKGGGTLSIGEQLANMRKEQAKAQQESSNQYFK